LPTAGADEILDGLSALYQNMPSPAAPLAGLMAWHRLKPQLSTPVQFAYMKGAVLEGTHPLGTVPPASVKAQNDAPTGVKRKPKGRQLLVPPLRWCLASPDTPMRLSGRPRSSALPMGSGAQPDFDGKREDAYGAEDPDA
jgi:hypothetical protein